MAEAPTMEVRARLTAETAQFTRGFQQATQATENFSKTASRVSSAMTGLGVAAGAVGASIIAIGLQSFRAAARVDELDIAMNAVGKSTGLGYAAIRESTLAIKANGIEMDIAQKAALKFAQNQIDLTQASELARVAQDLAVISGMNSSETFNMLTHAVITGRSEVLKSVGIQKSAGQMYESFAKSIGKTAAQLTHTEKQTAVLTGALAEGAKVAGTYEAAMTSPGKVLRSFARVQNEILVSMGNVLLAGFGPLIFSAYNFVKAMAKASEESKTVQTVLEAIKMVLTKLTAPIVVAIDKITEFVKGLDKVAGSADEARAKATKLVNPVKSLAEKFEMILPVLAAATAGFATFAGNKLLTNLPVIGKLLGFLKPLPVAMVVLALTSTQVRNALGNLFRAFKPLLPIVQQIGKVMATASVIGVAVLAKAINILAAIVRGVIGFIQQNINVIKVLAGAIALAAIAYGGYRLAIVLSTAATVLWGIATTAVTTVIKALRVAVLMLNAAMLLNPIPLIIGLVIALMVAFGYLMTTNEDFREVVKKVFNFVLKVIIYVFASVVTAIGMFIKGIAFLIRVFGIFVEAVVKVFEFVLDIILTIISSILKGFRFLIDGFVSLMESQGIFYDVVKFIFNAVIKVITLVVSGILNILGFIITGILNLIKGFNFLLRGAREIFFAVLDVISKVGKGIFSIFEMIAQGIGKFLGSSFDALTSWVRGLAKLLGFIPGLTEKVNSALNSVKATIISLPSKIVGLGQNAFDGIISGAKKAIDGVVGISAGVEKGLTTAETFLKKFSAKVKEFGDKDNGAKMIDFLVKGAKGASSALTTVIGVMQKIIDAPLSNIVGDFIDGIAEKVDKAGEMVFGLAATMMEFADKTDFAGIVGDKIGGFIDKIKESLKEGLGFGDILAEEKKKYEEASSIDDGTKAAEDAEKMANRLKIIREAMKQGIESIKGVLDDLQQAAKDFADSLRDTIVGFAGLKGIELPDGFIPKAKSLITNMEQRLNKSKEFAGQIYKLQSMGLDADALKSIIEEGPIKGAQIAASILGGGQSAIDEISRLQKEIQFTGAVIGEYGANVSFGQKIANASNQLRDLQNAETTIPTSNANSTFIQQGAFQVFVDTSGAANEEERVSIITREIERTFATLARQLASK
jgi:hypothetical protein